MRLPRRKTAVILSAGAPHAALMAGALAALHRHARLAGTLRPGLFDILYTSGAGALIGLLLAAPKTHDPETALPRVLDLAIADPIYNLLPVNYKAFVKPGPFTRPFQRMAEPLKALTGNTRLGNDLIDFWTAALTPTTLTPWSPGLCDPLPFLDDLVDFEALAAVEFYLNVVVPEAPETARRLFWSRTIGPDEVRAAFGYPFIYTPRRLDGQRAFEGALWDPICFGNLDAIASDEIQTVVMLDILTILAPFVLRAPRNWWDAFALTIMQPVVIQAMDDLAQFEARIDPATGVHRDHGFTYRKVAFEISDADGAHILDWSHSNMTRMFAIGQAAGDTLYRQHGGDL